MRKLLCLVLGLLLASCGRSVDATTSYLGLYKTGGGGNAITISLSYNRTSGPGPLAVRFDASSTTSTNQADCFRNCYYQFNFGDSGSGNWGDGTYGSSGNGSNLSRNEMDGGPIAAHVFNCSSGTTCSFTVTLTVLDGTTTNSTTQPITVTDPNSYYATTNTICVSGAGTFTGCPSGATQVTSADYVTQLTNNLATGKRVLFHGGENFASASSYRFQANGPWLVGSYGTGNAKFTPSGTGDVFSIGSQTNANYPSGGVISNVEIDGSTNATSGHIFGWNGNFDSLLIYGVYGHNRGGGLEINGDSVNAVNSTGGGHLPRDLVVQDSTFQTFTGGASFHGIDVFASSSAWLGNNIGDTYGTGSPTAEHVARLDYIPNSVWSHNKFSKGSPAKELITIRGLEQNPSDTSIYYANVAPAPSPTTNIVFADNDIDCSFGAFACMTIEGANNTMWVTLTKMIFERNWWRNSDATAVCTGHTCVQQAFGGRPTNSVFRDNVINLTNFYFDGGMGVFEMYSAANANAVAADSDAFYNNTLFAGTAGIQNNTYMLQTDTGATNQTGQNNIYYSPSLNGFTAAMTLGTGWTVNHNTGDVSTITTCPKWAADTTCAGSPATFAAFKIDATSLYASTGISVPVLYDALGVAWSGTYDIGAIKH